MLTPELLVLAMSDRVAAPRDSSEFEPSNRLLAALPGMDLQSLQPHLEAAPLVGGSILFEVDEPLMRVYFVETGVVSLLTAIATRVGVATVGREGAVGVATLLLGGDRHRPRAVPSAGARIGPGHRSPGVPERAAPKPEAAHGL